MVLVTSNMLKDAGENTEHASWGGVGQGVSRYFVIDVVPAVGQHHMGLSVDWC